MKHTRYLKHLILFTMLLFAFILTGCDNTTVPDGYDASSYKLCTKALKKTDQYLDGKISAQTAASDLKDLSDQLDALQFDSKTTEAVYHALMKLSVEAIVENLEAIENGEGDANDILLDRNVLASYLQVETLPEASDDAS